MSAGRRRFADAFPCIPSYFADARDLQGMAQRAADSAYEVLGVEGALVVLTSVGGSPVCAFAGLPTDLGQPSGVAMQLCLEAIERERPQTWVGSRFSSDAESQTPTLRGIVLPLRRRVVHGALAFFYTDLPDRQHWLSLDGPRLANAMAACIERERALEAANGLAAQLEHALRARVEIEQAKGLLAGRLDLSIDDALGRLREYARSNHLRLGDLAADVLSGKVPIRALTPGEANAAALGSDGVGSLGGRAGQAPTAG